MTAATSHDAPTRGDRLKSWLAPLADAVVAVTRLHGIASDGGAPATMLVAGRTKHVEWLVDRFFATPPAREALGHFPAWRIARALRQLRSSADLTVVHVARRSVAPLGFANDYLAVPDWIGMRLVAPFDVASSDRRSHSLVEDLRRIRRGRWVFEVSHRAADLAPFRDGMYAPYTRLRHGPGAHLQPMRRLRRAFRRGGLLWVSRDGERVAGCLFERRNDSLAALALGVAGGDPARLKDGPIPALYARLIELARSSGCTDVDLRGSRPSLDDGLTWFKRKWGAAVYDRPDVPSTLLVHWSRMTPVVEAFLAGTSLVFRDGGGLSALAVASARHDERAAVERACGRLRTPGLHRIVVLAGAAAAGPQGACVAIPIADVQCGPRALVARAPD